MYLLMLFLQAGHMHQHGGNEAFVPDPVSIFDHHLAGVLLILMGIFAFLEHSSLASRHNWIKYLYPLPLLGLGLFLFFFRDPEPWFQWLLNGEFDKTEVQHKFFETIAVLVGLIELFRRTKWLHQPAWPQVLNVLMLGGALFLLFHTGQHSAIIHLQHRWMGIVAITLAASKILSDVGWGGRWLGRYAVPALMLIFGLQFAFYVER